MRKNPLDAVHVIAAAERLSYYGAGLQRSCILARLMRGPASRHELERTCGAPSATKRISELRRMGYEIGGGWAPMAGPGGTVSVAMVYCLTVPDDRQGSLFGEAASA